MYINLTTRVFIYIFRLILAAESSQAVAGVYPHLAITGTLLPKLWDVILPESLLIVTYQKVVGIVIVSSDGGCGS